MQKLGIGKILLITLYRFRINNADRLKIRSTQNGGWKKKKFTKLGLGKFLYLLIATALDFFLQTQVLSKVFTKEQMRIVM